MSEHLPFVNGSYATPTPFFTPPTTTPPSEDTLCTAAVEFVFPDHLKAQLDEYGVTNMGELDEVIIEYQDYVDGGDDSKRESLGFLVSAKEDINRHNSPPEETKTINPAARASEIATLLAEADFADANSVTSKLNVIKRKVKQDPFNASLSASLQSLEASQLLCAEYKVITGSTYVRPPVSSSATSVPTASPSMNSTRFVNVSTTTPTPQVAAHSNEAPSPPIDVSVAASTTLDVIDMSELHSRGSNSIEEYKQLVEEAMTIPPSVEGYLAQLATMALLAFHTNQNDVVGDLKDLYNKMVASVERERWFTHSQDRDRLKRLSAALEVGDLKIASEVSQSLLKMVRPLNFLEVLRLAIATHPATQLLHKKKNVVLVLGSTGAGKSTLIKWLGGAKMVNVHVLTPAGNRVPHLHGVIPPGSRLESFSSSPGFLSETRFVNVLEVEHNGIFFNITDSPGLDDSQSTAVDVSNCKGLKDALSSAYDARMVVMVGAIKERKEKLTLVSNLATVARLLKNPEEGAKSILFVLNNIPVDQQSTFKDMVREILIAVSNNQPDFNYGPSVTVLLRALVVQLEKEVWFTNPLVQSPKELMNRIEQVPIIDDPEISFSPFLSTSSKNIVENQLQLDLAAIKQAFEISPINFKFIAFKLDTLKRLLDEMANDDYKRTYDAAMKAVRDYGQKVLEQACANFDNALSRGEMTSYDVKQFVAACDALVELESALCRSDGVSHLTEEDLLQERLIGKLEAAAKLYQRKVESLPYGPELSHALSNIELLDSETKAHPKFPLIGVTYNVACDSLKSKLLQSVSKLKDLRWDSDLTPVAAELDSLNRFIVPQSLEVHLSEAYEASRTNLTALFNNVARATCGWQLFTPFMAPDEQFEAAKTFVDAFDRMDSALQVSLSSHVHGDSISNAVQQLLENISHYFTSCCAYIKQRIPSFEDYSLGQSESSSVADILGEEADFSSLKEHVASLKLMKQFPGLAMLPDVQTQYQSVILALFHCMRDAQERIKILIHATFRQSQQRDDDDFWLYEDNSSIKQIRSVMNVLMSASWLSVYQADVMPMVSSPEKVASLVKKQLLDFAGALMTRLRRDESRMKLNNSSCLSKNLSFVERLFAVSELSDLIPELGVKVNEISSWLCQLAKETAGQIQELHKKDARSEINRYLGEAKRFLEVYTSKAEEWSEARQNLLNNDHGPFSSLQALQNRIFEYNGKVTKLESQLKDSRAELEQHLKSFTDIEGQYRSKSSDRSAAKKVLKELTNGKYDELKLFQDSMERETEQMSTKIEDLQSQLSNNESTVKSLLQLKSKVENAMNSAVVPEQATEYLQSILPTTLYATAQQKFSTVQDLHNYMQELERIKSDISSRNLTLEFEPANLDRLTQAVRFLSLFPKSGLSPDVHVLISAVDEPFLEFVKQYIAFVRERIMMELNAIFGEVSLNSSNGRSDPKSHSKAVAMLYKELCHFKLDHGDSKEFKELRLLASQYCAEAYEYLKKKHGDINKQLRRADVEQSGKQELLDQVVAVANFEVEFDPFTPTWDSMYLDSTSLAQEETQKLIKDARQYILQFNLEQLEVEMNQLQSGNETLAANKLGTLLETVLTKKIRLCSSVIISWELERETQANDIQVILSQLMNFEKGTGIQILLPYAKLQEEVENLKKQVSSRLNEFIRDLGTSSRHKDVSSTQASFRSLKTICQLFSNISPDLVPNLSELQRTVEGAANAIIDMGKLTGFSRWFISRPLLQMKKLVENEHKNGYERVISDNISGILEWIREPRTALRVLESPDLNESLISVLYKHVNKSESRPDDVWPCFVVCRDGESKPTLRFVEDAFVSLNNVPILPFSPKSPEPESNFEAFLSSLSPHDSLPTELSKRLLGFTQFVIHSSVLRSHLLAIIESAIIHLPEDLMKANQNTVQDLKKLLANEASAVVSQALSAASKGNKSDFDMFVGRLKKDGGSTALNEIFDKLSQDYQSADKSLLAQLQACNSSLKGLSSSTTSLPLSELQQIYDLSLVDIRNAAQYETARSRFTETCDHVLRSIAGLDKPNSSTYSIFSTLWTERDRPLVKNIGFDEKRLNGCLTECSNTLKRSEEAFNSVLESISNLTEMTSPQIIEAINSLVETKKIGEEFVRTLSHSHLPQDHVLFTTVSGMKTAAMIAQHLFDRGAQLQEHSSDFVRSLKENFCEDNDVRRRGLVDLLMSIQLQLNIAKVLHTVGATMDGVSNLGKGPLLKLQSFLTEGAATYTTLVAKRDLTMKEATPVSNFLTILSDFSYSPLNRRVAVEIDGIHIEKIIGDGQSQILQGLNAKRERFCDSIEWHAVESTVIDQAHNASVELMKLVSLFPVISNELYKDIETILDKIGDTPNGLLLLRTKLVQTGVGSKIVNKFAAFSGEMAYRFNEATKSISNDAAVKSLGASEFLDDPFNPDSKVNDKIKQVIEKKLLQRAGRYQKTFDRVLAEHLCDDINYNELLNKCESLTEQIMAQPSKAKRLMGYFGFDSKDEKVYTTYLPDLLAHVFVTWTLKRAKHYFKAKKATGATPDSLDSYLLKPKPAQILAIFRLLGVGDEDEGSKVNGAAFSNQLIEVKTGEGKSVTLAVAAILLAFLGYHVDVACYSEYMTKRDFESFSDLFEVLNVSKQIRYGTFPSLCKDLLNADFNICSRVNKILRGEKPEKVNQAQDGPARILLIDEVDVFFSKNFYGSLFIPELPFGQGDSAVLTLVKEIWNLFKRNNKPPTFEVASALPAFQSCVDKFPLITRILPDAVRFMLAALEDFNQPAYRVDSDRIGYPQIDGTLAFDVNFGPKTMWAHFSEHEKGAISKEAVERSVSFGLHCGHFSYSEIPRLYSTIMGVTGTLRDMSSAEKGILNQYGISRFAFIPSIYGSSKSPWIPNEDTHVITRQVNDTDDTHKEEFFMAIGREIQSEMQVDAADPKRDNPGAVLVFFENDHIMEEFKASSHGLAQFPNGKTLDPRTDQSKKQIMVGDSTCSGHVTFMVQSLGRGTDFICVDPLVLKRGGAKVVQTFLSKEKSEETQIRGRTGRQGQPGRYCMVLSSDQLVQLDITAEMLAEAVSGTQKYAKLDEARNAYFLREYLSNLDQVKFAQSEHLHATKFLQQLRAAQVQEVLKFIESQNRAPIPPSTSASRVLVAIDGTGSMSGCIAKTKSTIGQTFYRLDVVLKEAGIAEGAFKMQFVIYRNYNAPPNMLLECSGWSQSPIELERWLASIVANYGQGDEAIEVALQYANELAIEPDGLDQIVIIGDAPPNTPQEVSLRRSKADWNGTRFQTVATADGEIAKLVHTVNGAREPIPISCFAVAPQHQKPYPSTVAAFQAISTRTRGAYKTLDVFEDSAAEYLTGILSKRVLVAVAKGDTSAAENLINIYDRTNWATHRS